MKELTFLIYIAMWNGVLLIGTGWLTFVKGHSYWWWILAILLMTMSFKPHHFGLSEPPSKKSN